MITSGITKGIVSGITRGLTGDAVASEFLPNDGAVDFASSSYYTASIVTPAPEVTKFSGLFFYNPDAAATAHCFEMGWLTPDKAPLPVYTFEWRKTATGAQRFSSSTDTGLVFRATTAEVHDSTEYNIFGFSFDKDATSFLAIKWSETEGKFVREILAPTTNTGSPFPLGEATQVAFGADVLAGSPTRYFSGVQSQFALFPDIAFDFFDQDLLDQILLPAAYLDWRNIGDTIIAHSGNTSTFPTNNAQSAIYSTLVANGVGLTDTTAPTPPFTLNPP